MVKKTKANAPQRRPQTKRAQRAPKQQRTGGRKRGATPSTPKLEKCVVDYTNSVLNPFALHQGPCVPVFPGIPSLKQTFRARGVAAIGAAQVGFVGVNLAAYADSTNGQSNVIHSTGTYAGSTIEPANGSNGVLPARHNSPYAPSDFGVGYLESRLVSCGIKCRYIGTELERSGNLVAIADPHGHDLDGNTITSLMLYDKGESQPHDRKWRGISWTPTTIDDTGFTSSGVTRNAPGNSPMAVMFTGSPGQQVEFETIWHFELIGKDARGKTPTPVSEDATKRAISWLDTLSSVDYVPIWNGVARTAEMLARMSMQRRLTY